MLSCMPRQDRLPASSHSHIMGQIQNRAEDCAFTTAPQQRGARVDVLLNVVSPWCSLFVNTEEEYIPDSESVRQQRELHHQPQTCTLSQCFQLYTKEEQVGTILGAARAREVWLVHMLHEFHTQQSSSFLQTPMCQGRRRNLYHKANYQPCWQRLPAERRGLGEVLLLGFLTPNVDMRTYSAGLQFPPCEIATVFCSIRCKGLEQCGFFMGTYCSLGAVVCLHT